ncbi:MAG: PqiC family protein [Desulfobacterales bacterium]
MRASSVSFSLLLLSSLAVLVGGCFPNIGAPSKPTQFYVLNSREDMETGSAAPTMTLASGAPVGVGPVRIPQYLDRPHIVIRAEENRVRISTFSYWAEPLQDGLTRVLVDNLSILLKPYRVETLPWARPADGAYRLEVSVIRFDGDVGKNATLRVRWSLIAEKDQRELLSKESIITEPVTGPEMADLLSALSRAVADFTREIAEAVAALETRG